ncbi:MAG: pyrimidine dimer DNA glycosylase/endonuclease V [Peptococcaceae bacterium]
MRLWSIHPRYLDVKGLVALWREALLAQQVLINKTQGYRLHPQLSRFKKAKEPLAVIGGYLYQVYLEACQRGYKFDKGKILSAKKMTGSLPVNRGQIIYEFEHLKKKLILRDPEKYQVLVKVSPDKLEANPVFIIVNGEIEEWERI